MPISGIEKKAKALGGPSLPYCHGMSEITEVQLEVGFCGFPSYFPLGYLKVEMGGYLSHWEMVLKTSKNDSCFSNHSSPRGEIKCDGNWKIMFWDVLNP